MISSNQQSRTNFLLLSLASFLGAIALFFSLLGFPPLDAEIWELLLLVTFTILCFLPVIIDGIRGKLDIFEPVHYLALTLFIYYGLMVIIHLVNDSFLMLGINYRHIVPKMLALTILSLVSFYAGYYLIESKRSQNHKEAAPCLEKPEERKFLQRVAFALFGFFTFLILLWIIVGGIPLSTLFIFTGADYGDWWQSAAGPKIGYLYAARNSLPACLLLIIGTRSNKQRWPVKYIVFALIIGILLSGTGGRSRILLLAMSLWAFLYLEQDKRPNWVQVLLTTLIVFYFIIGAIGFYRGQARIVGQTEFTLTDAWQVFEESSSIAVATATKLHWFPDYTGYLRGQSFLKIFIQWIPGFIWPGKYQLFTGFGGFGQYFAVGSATAYWTTWYVNFGPLGVIGGMLLIAWWGKHVYKQYLADRTNLFAQTSLALIGPFLVVAFGRGDPAAWFYDAIYIFAPISMAYWFLKYYRIRHQRNSQKIRGIR